MRCPICQQEHPQGAQFCPVTGRPIPPATPGGQLCPNCGTPVQPQWAACPRCNYMLQPARSTQNWLIWLLLGGGLLLTLIGLVMLLDLGQVMAGWVQSTPTPRVSLTAEAPRVQAEEPTRATISERTRTPRPQGVVSATPWPTLTAPAASGAVVLYSRGKDGKGEIYALNPESGVERPLTSNNTQDEGPSVAPEGDRIVFSSFRGGSYQLVVKDLRSGAERQITTVAGKALFPDWSPVAADERIIFEWVNAEKYSAIYVVNADGTGLEALTKFGADSRAHWSPDGRRVLFARALRDSYQDGKITASDYMDLFVLDLVSGAEIQLTDTPDYDDYDGCWSPDGAQIAFGSVRGETSGDRFINLDDAKDLFVMPAIGGSEQRLDLGGLRPFSMDWSADGGQIVFTHDTGPATQLWLVEVSTGRTRRLNAAGAALHSEWGYLAR